MPSTMKQFSSFKKKSSETPSTSFQIECRFCQLNFSPTELQRHLFSTHLKNVFLTKKWNPDEWKSLLEDQASTVPPYSCAHCESSSFSTLNAFTRHLVRNHCEEELDRAMKHLQCANWLEDKFECAICHKWFKTEVTLKSHEQLRCKAISADEEAKNLETIDNHLWTYVTQSRKGHHSMLYVQSETRPQCMYRLQYHRGSAFYSKLPPKIDSLVRESVEKWFCTNCDRLMRLDQANQKPKVYQRQLRSFTFDYKYLKHQASIDDNHHVDCIPKPIADFSLSTTSSSQDPANEDNAPANNQPTINQPDLSAIFASNKHGRNRLLFLAVLIDDQLKYYKLRWNRLRHTNDDLGTVEQLYRCSDCLRIVNNRNVIRNREYTLPTYRCDQTGMILSGQAAVYCGHHSDCGQPRTLHEYKQETHERFVIDEDEIVDVVM